MTFIVHRYNYTYVLYLFFINHLNIGNIRRSAAVSFNLKSYRIRERCNYQMIQVVALMYFKIITATIVLLNSCYDKPVPVSRDT